MTRSRRSGARWVAIGIVVIVVSPALAPELLAFPYRAQSNGQRVYSVDPIDERALDRVTARANRLVGQSPLARTREQRSIFLTGGGWRWRWLSISSSGSIAFTRPGRNAVIVNGGVDLEHDRKTTFMGSRSLSGVIAHETCHGMVRHRFGITADMRKPNWLVEGYCDHVADESTLSDAQAKALASEGARNMALDYWRGRKRVERELAANGDDVIALFDAH